MSTVNHHTREINFKVVYYGPGLGGKTSCLQYLHRALKPETRGPLVMLPTGHDRTIYFDFLPLKLPKLHGYTTRVHLYTVPGQVYYNSTRQLVLSGVDGLVFVVDSQRARLDAAAESLQNLRENLAERKLKLDQIPWIIQYNKRDLPDAVPHAELESVLNSQRVEAFPTVAIRGVGVLDALKAIVKHVLLAYRVQAAAEPNDPVFRADPLEEVVQDAPEQRPAPERRGRDADPTPVPVTPPQKAKAEPPPPAPAPMAPAATSAGRAKPKPKPEEGDDRGSRASIPSLGAIAGAVDRYVESASPRREPQRESRPTPVQAAARSKPLPHLATLVSSEEAVQTLADLEARLTEADWPGTLLLAREACLKLAAEHAPQSPGKGGSALTMLAFIAGVPPPRHFRFEEAVRRAREGGAVTAADAAFAYFFYCDLVMRAEERRVTTDLNARTG